MGAVRVGEAEDPKPVPPGVASDVKVRSVDKKNEQQAASEGKAAKDEVKRQREDTKEKLAKLKEDVDASNKLEKDQKAAVKGVLDEENAAGVKVLKDKKAFDEQQAQKLEAMQKDVKKQRKEMKDKLEV